MHTLEPHQEHFTLFRALFHGRDDAYALHWTNPRTGKSGYKPLYAGAEGKSAVTDDVITAHLRGDCLIGLYPLLSDNTCHFLAIDLDKDEWLKDACSLIEVAKAHDLTCYLERSKSGNGGHLWFFFDQKIASWKARQLGKIVLHEAGLTREQSFDRMFPSQDEHTGKGLGNLIALPLNGKCLQEGNTAFITLQGKPHFDQWEFLSQCKTNPKEIVDYILNQCAFPEPEKEPKKSVERVKSEVETIETQQAKVILNSSLFFPILSLPDKLYKFLRRKLVFQNPMYLEQQRRGYSTWRVPRWIFALRRTKEGVEVPMGFLKELQAFAAENGLQLSMDDQRTNCKSVSFKTNLQLKDGQKELVSALLKHNRVILEARPGFGKTMVALYCMKRQGQPTLIIVHTKALLQQWKKRIEQCFDLKKGDLGIIGDNKWKIGKKVTVASYKTLMSRGVEEIKNQFGFLIVDECHHVPAKTFTEVVSSFPAKYVLGLTATAYRRDKLHLLLPLYIGPVVKVDEIPEIEVQPSVRTVLHIKQTGFETKQRGEMDFHLLIDELTKSVMRNQRIVDDLVIALHSGAKCLVLTERVEHCEALLDLVRRNIKGIHADVARGYMTKKARERLSQRLRQERFQLLIATGKLIGEGFDWPECTHLFLTCPFSFRGTLVQYVGRVQRQAEGKDAAFVFDYTDWDVPVLKGMYFKRLRTYRAMGLVRGSGQKVSEAAPTAQMAMF